MVTGTTTTEGVKSAERGGRGRHSRRWLALGALLVIGLCWSLWGPAPAPPEASFPGTPGRPRAPAVTGEPAARAPGSAAPHLLPRVGRDAPSSLEAPTLEESAHEVGEVEMRTPPRLYGGAKVEPLYDLRSDALQGVRLSKVREGSFWEVLGVREGDVVLALNGTSMDSPAASVMLMNALSLDPVLILQVRGEDGRERFLEYRSPRDP